MKLKEQGKIQRIIAIILFTSWLILIFTFSNQPGDISLESSNGLIDLIDNFFKFLNLNLDIKELSFISFFVRKCAHMFLYFILYFLGFYVMYQFRISKRFLYTFIFCVFYALSDEIHQLFIPNRSFQVTDVLIDSFGSFLAFLILYIKKNMRRPCKF